MVAAVELVEIGDHCMFANGCFVTDGDHRFDDPDKPVPWQGFTTKGPTRIGDNVWCGANVVVTSGVTIGERCVIGAEQRRHARTCRRSRSPPARPRGCCARSSIPSAWTRSDAGPGARALGSQQHDDQVERPVGRTLPFAPSGAHGARR